MGSISLWAVQTAQAEPAKSKIHKKSAKVNKNDVLEEIIVTARKREEGLQTIPVSVTAFNAEAMKARNLTKLTDIGNFAPNVSMDATTGNGSGSNVMIYIRGVGQNDFLFTTDPGVGIYI
ncbi:MAG: Plug domain-containing protein, partial [Alphaproteobacteria bacterium]|nr:Plug domain-containing protein [Alphaproteobacteria bacterium]